MSFPDFTTSALVFVDVSISGNVKDKVIAFLPEWNGTTSELASKPLPYRELYSEGAGVAFRQKTQFGNYATIHCHSRTALPTQLNFDLGHHN